MPTPCDFALPTLLTRPFLMLCILTGVPLLAQQRPAVVARTETPTSSFQAVNASIDTILQQYEQLTGYVLIKDSNLAANALPISISVPEPVPRSELVMSSKTARRRLNYPLFMATENHSRQAFSLRARLPYRNMARTGCASQTHTETACRPRVSSTRAAGTRPQESPYARRGPDTLFQSWRR
jgi:hypothetical protein